MKRRNRSDQAEGSPEQKAIEGWWARVEKRLVAMGHKIEHSATLDYNENYSLVVDGAMVRVTLRPRACADTWAGKSCQRASIQFGNPPARFYEGKHGFDVEKIAEKAALLIQHLVAQHKKAEKIERQRTTVRNTVAKINQEMGGADRVGPHDYNWGVEVGISYSKKPGRSYLRFCVDAEVTEAKARQLAKACAKILGPAVKADKE